MRSVASLPCLSPASFLTISYVLTALPLAEPRLPLPPTALSTQLQLTHTYTHDTDTVTQTQHTQVHNATHIGAHTWDTHMNTFQGAHAHTFTCPYTHVHAFSHIQHTQEYTHTYSHSCFPNLQLLQIFSPRISLLQTNAHSEMFLFN